MKISPLEKPWKHQTLDIYIEKKTNLHTYILIYTERDRDLAGNVDGVGLCSQKIPIFFLILSNINPTKTWEWKL